MSAGARLRALAGKLRNAWHFLALRNVVAAQMPVLSVACAQLQETNRQVEEGVGKISANFERMAGQAQQAVQDASRLAGAAKPSAAFGTEDPLASARKTLEDLLSRIVKDGSVCEGLGRRMDALETDMAQITNALADVDRISFGNTILALNARIEAAHLGDRGQGFEVVAQELWTQARRSEQITGQIRDVVGRLASDADTARAEIGGLTCSDTTKVAAVQDRVSGVLEVLERRHAEMRDSLAATAARSQTLQEEIHGAVVSLQFQDRVSQRIAHVIEALDFMGHALSAPFGGTTQAPEHTSLGGASQLANAYTMEGERLVHRAALGEAPASEETGGDVELF